MTLELDLSKTTPELAADDDALRSEVMRRLIVAPRGRGTGVDHVPPRTIVQFWDDKGSIPADVQACMSSWSGLRASGYEYILFDDESAAKFIAQKFGDRELSAFGRCVHPAMRADYFRLCFMLSHGGLYVDADDVYVGNTMEYLFVDDRLRVQPLCYDIDSDSMIEPSSVAQAGTTSHLIFYVNNNPLVAPANHPLVRSALDRSTDQLLRVGVASRDIQSLTGPGNLTAVIVSQALSVGLVANRFEFELLTDWISTARSEWPLDYRSTDRNWRNWVRGNDIVV